MFLQWLCQVSVEVNWSQLPQKSGSEREVAENLKWKQNSTKNFLTNYPHIYTWTFQIHLVILPANSPQLIKCFHVCIPFFAGCEPWTSISHPGCCWRLKKSLLDLSFLQAPPVDRYTPWYPPRSMGLRTLCVFVCTLSLLHGQDTRNSCTFFLQVRALSSAQSTVRHIWKPHPHPNTLWKLSALPRMLTEMSCWFIQSFDDE